MADLHQFGLQDHSFDELADIVVKLLLESKELHNENTRLRIKCGQAEDENAAQDRRITELECQISQADETMLAIEIEGKREGLARANDASLAKHSN